jgi:hypothetical protein
MSGILEKIKGIFGKKEEKDETTTRLESKRLIEQVGDQEFVPRYKLAKKFREDRELDMPLIKRKKY